MKIFWKIWGVLMAGGLFVMVVFGFTVMASMQEVNRSQSDSLAVMQRLVKEGPKDGVSSTKTQKAESALRNIDTQTRQRVIRKFIMFFAPALLAVTLMGLMTSWYVCHSLNKPLSGVGATLKAIANGDLTQSVEYEFPPYGLVRETDEIGRMIGQLDEMREGLARVVRDTKGNVGGVEGASDDFMKSATGLSESMATLWQLLKEVEGSVERISSHLMFVAGHIPQALRRTGETVNDIGHIQTSLQEVSGAVKALDEFVDDTAGVVAEFGTTMENINQNTLSLKGQVEESAQVITDMVESINNASGRSDHLSRSVSKTVSAIEEMVMSLTSLRQMAEGMDESLRSTESAMSFLVQSSKDVEESAKSLGQTARQSKRLAEEGGDAVHRTMEGMNNIQRAVLSATRTVRSLGDEGKKIGEIVDTVAAIAEQTNLLALNAAIEAARAGEQGKGFAVVADEVRQLAEKSQRSTKEIAAMITKIRQGTEEAVRSMEEGNNEVRHGHELATEAGETLGRIVEGVRQTSTLIDQIVEKTTEQNAQGENLRRVMGEVLRYGENVREFTRKQEGGTKSMKRTMGELKDIALDLKDHTALQLQGTGRIQGTVEKLRAITQHIAVSTDQQHEGATQMQHSIQAIKTKTAAIKSATEQQARDGDRILEASNDMKRTLEQVGIRVKDLEGDSHGLVDRTQRAFGVVENTREEAEKVHEKTQDLQKVVVSLRKSVQRFTISPGPLTGGPRVTGMRLLDEGGEG